MLTDNVYFVEIGFESLIFGRPSVTEHLKIKVFHQQIIHPSNKIEWLMILLCYLK